MGLVEISVGNGGVEHSVGIDVSLIGGASLEFVLDVKANELIRNRSPVLHQDQN